MQVRQLSPDLAVSPQIEPAHIAELAKAGFKAVICNRPDGEAHDQPPFAMIEQAARAAGLEARYLPVAGGVDHMQVDAFATMMAELPKPVLAYCRSGMRSSTLASHAGVSGAGPSIGTMAANAAAGLKRMFGG